MFGRKKVVKSEYGNKIIVYFAEKPSEATRRDMKNAGFKWYNSRACWYADYTPFRWQVAQMA
ncbi:MAG: hypothetical protein LUG61_02525 [Lachnospiraceae bacterium]|nr:hypothetical protein [Lachnospiraceae bacterium]